MKNQINEKREITEIVNASRLARLAGIPHPTFMTRELVRAMGCPKIHELHESLEMHLLAWSVAGAMTDHVGRCRWESKEKKVYCLEVPCKREGISDVLPVIATLYHPKTEMGTLHLALEKEHTALVVPLVLVVDDNEMLSRLICRMLHQSGMVTKWLDQGGQVASIARDFQPDLILLDVELPDVSGFEVCKALKREPDLLNIPIVFCTGRPGSKEEGMRVGAVDCLEKPGDMRCLVERLSPWIKGYSKPAVLPGHPICFQEGNETKNEGGAHV